MRGFYCACEYIQFEWPANHSNPIQFVYGCSASGWSYCELRSALSGGGDCRRTVATEHAYVWPHHMQEQLRNAAKDGDMVTVKRLLMKAEVNVNSLNQVRNPPLFMEVDMGQ